MRDEIIKMAREAGFIINDDNLMTHSLERFYNLAVQHEREECAKVCANLMTPWDENTTNSGTISLINDGMRQCAAAIRARGQNANG